MTASSAFCAPRRFTLAKGLALAVVFLTVQRPQYALSAPGDPPPRTSTPLAEGSAMGAVISDARENDAAPPPQPDAALPQEPQPGLEQNPTPSATSEGALRAEDAPPAGTDAELVPLDPTASPAASGTSDAAPPLDATSPAAVSEDDGQARHSRRAQKLRVAVVPVRRWLPRAFDLQVANELMEPLVHKVELIPLPLVRQAVGRMHVTPDQLHLPASLRTLGRRLNADFVMIVEPSGRRANPHLFVALVDVHTGETPVAKRLPLPRGRIRAAHAEAVMPQIFAALQSAMPDEAPIEPELSPATAPEEAPKGEESEAKERAKEKVEDKVAEEAPPKDGEFDGPELAHLRLGLALIQRVGHLTDTQNSGVVPPQYAGTNNNSNPFFPAFSLEGRVYSGLIHKSRRKWYDGFGLALDLQITQVNSYTDDDTSSKISSQVVKFDGMVVYRALVLPHKELSPMAELGVGIGTFAFPLKGAEFPGVAYRAPLIELNLTAPVHRLVWLNAHVGVMPSTSTGSDAGTMLGKVDQGFGFLAGGGVAGRYRIFTGEIAFDYRHYALSFTGQTSLAQTVTLSDGSQAQFTNIKLSDSIKEIQLRVGVIY